MLTLALFVVILVLFILLRARIFLLFIRRFFFFLIKLGILCDIFILKIIRRRSFNVVDELACDMIPGRSSMLRSQA